MGTLRFTHPTPRSAPADGQEILAQSLQPGSKSGRSASRSQFRERAIRRGDLQSVLTPCPSVLARSERAPRRHNAGCDSAANGRGDAWRHDAARRSPRILPWIRAKILETRYPVWCVSPRKGRTAQGRSAQTSFKKQSVTASSSMCAARINADYTPRKKY